MGIPDFDENGVLPMGIYEANIKEAKEYFCSYGNKEHRTELFSVLEKYICKVKEHDTKIELILDGSFVTNKNEPSDLDILLFYEYTYCNEEWLELIDDDLVRIKYTGLHVLSGLLDTENMEYTLDFAHDFSEKPKIRKGLVRVIL